MSDDRDAAVGGERDLVIAGRLTRLFRPSVSDYDLFAEWISPESKTALLTGDRDEDISGPALRRMAAEGKAHYCTIVAGDSRVVGLVNYRELGGGGGAYEIGGAIGPEGLWARGFGAEAFGLLIQHLFIGLKARRVQFNVAAHNRHMMQMMVSLRYFVLEGILRDYHHIDGEYYDRTIWSMLRHEFYSKIAAEEDPEPVGELRPSEPLIPWDEALESRRSLERYLVTNPPTSISTFIGRDANRLAGRGDGVRTTQEP